MRDHLDNLEARLRADAPAWRDALSDRSVHAGPERARERRAGSLRLLIPLGLAALLALAFVTLWTPGAAPPRGRTAELPAPAVEPFDVTMLVPRLEVPAPELSVARYDAALVAPMRDEAERLRADAATAIEFVAGLVPLPLRS